MNHLLTSAPKTILRKIKAHVKQFDRKEKDQASASLTLYQKENLEECLWPQSIDGQYAQAFLTPLIKDGVHQYIDNVHTDLRVLKFDDTVIPITVNDGQYDNSYVCSPFGFFISYAQQSLGTLFQTNIRYMVDQILNAFGKTIQTFEFNKVVLVNNWFFSTHLYPQIKPSQVKRMVEFLQESFPEHAIVFRSIDPYTNPICYRTLLQMECDYISTRQIFLIDPHASTLYESRLFKSDMKLLNKSDYQILSNQELSEADIPRMLELYRDLYIQKYSHLNPKFNEKFLQLALSNNLLTFKALKKEGRIDGIVGFMERNGKMYCPYFGYDGHVSKDQSLYRILSTVLMLEAYERRLFFHQSSGASTFKSIRKAKGCIEYTAVFYKHLKIQRHLPWMMLKNLYNTAGLFYMKKY